MIVNLDLKWHKSSWKDILDYMHFQLVLLFPNKSKFGLILNPSLFYVFKVLTDKVLTDNRLTAFVNKLTQTIDCYRYLSRQQVSLPNQNFQCYLK